MNSKRHFLQPAQSIDDLAPIVERPQYREILGELQALEALHSQKENDRKRLLARARGEKTKRAAAERARDLLAGGKIDPTDPADGITAVDEELAILRSAIGEKTRALDAVAIDLSYSESEKVKHQFDQLMRDALAAMEALAGAFGTAAGLADRLARAGYRPSAILLPNLIPEGAMQLGDPSVVGMSQAWRFKKALEERGIVE
jgi:hypothetical protein